MSTRHGFENELLRGKLNRRAEKALPPGEVRESGFPLQSSEEPLGLRDNPRFSDQSGAPIIGMSYIGGMTT